MPKLTSSPKVTSKPNKSKKKSLDGVCPQGELMRAKKKIKPMKKLSLMRGK